MREIIRIEGTEERKDKNGKRYYRTYAILDDGSEVTGFGSDFDLGDKVQSFFHRGVCKMRKPPIDK